MKTEVDLLIILAHSRSESSDTVAWSKIEACLKDGVDIFSPFIIDDDKNKFEQDPLIYFAFKLCNSAIVEKLLKYADNMKQTIDLSYHMYDLNVRKKTGQPNEKLQWNILQHCLFYCDLPIVEVLCKYYALKYEDAIKDGKNPLKISDIIHEPIRIENAVICPQEMMVGAISIQTTNSLDTEAYPEIQKRKELKKRVVAWMTGKNLSITKEFNVENPLQLISDGRLNVFQYLIDNKYINLRATTAIGNKFYEWLEKISKRPNSICQLVEISSKASSQEIKAFKTEEEQIVTHGLVTATGFLTNFDNKYPIAIKSWVDLRELNNLVQKTILEEDAEIARQKRLEEIKAAAPQSEVRRHSFDLLKKKIEQTPGDRRETFTNREDLSDPVKKSYRTIWKRVHTHINARELTATKILDAKPVTRDAKIGKMIQTAFDVAVDAIPIVNDFANFLPKLSGMVLEYNTSKKANEQSETVFQATLNANADSVCTDLAGILTAMIVKEYGRTPRIEIAEYVAKKVNKAIDDDLNNFVINNDAELFAFLLAYANKALSDSLTAKQFLEFHSYHSDTTSNSSGSGHKDDDEHVFAAIKDHRHTSSRKKKNTGGGCCNIS